MNKHEFEGRGYSYMYMFHNSDHPFKRCVYRALKGERIIASLHTNFEYEDTCCSNDLLLNPEIIFDFTDDAECTWEVSGSSIQRQYCDIVEFID